MKMLKLDLDRLVVESFVAEPVVPTDRKGTVRGHQTGMYTCYPCTDWDTCGGTCYWTPCV